MVVCTVKLFILILTAGTAISSKNASVALASRDMNLLFTEDIILSKTLTNKNSCTCTWLPLSTTPITANVRSPFGFIILERVNYIPELTANDGAPGGGLEVEGVPSTLSHLARLCV